MLYFSPRLNSCEVLPALRFLQVSNVVELWSTGVRFPSEIITWGADTSVIPSECIRNWTGMEWNVVVTDVIEMMDLVLVQKQCSSNRMDRGVTPSFVEEPTSMIQMIEELCVGFTSP